MRVPVFFPLLCAALGSACDQSGSTAITPMMTVDADTSEDMALPTPVGAMDAGDNGSVSTTYPGPFPDPPQVVSSHGPVLTKPVFVPILFANDDAAMKMQVEEFLAKVGATEYWKSIAQEYKVGAGTSTPPVNLTEMPSGTLSDATIQMWLAAKLNSDDKAFPPATSQSIYAIVYPDGVTITLPGQGGVSQSCKDFGGYHGDIKLDKNHKSMNVAYAVIPRCGSFGNLVGIDGVTGTLSHELAEAVTDPFPHALPAFGQVDSDHLYWLFALGGGEVGDLCAQDAKSFTKFAGLDYTVQRTWSNVAAMAGRDPCVPALPGEVYFNTVPELNDMISLGFGGTMLGVNIPVGTSQTITLDLYSEGDTGGPWTIRVQDAAALQGGKATLGFALDRNKGQNGEKVHLTITNKKATQFGAAIFYITSTLGNAQHSWFGLVGG